MEHELTRIAQLERQIAFLYHHLGLDPAAAAVAPTGPSFPPEFTAALQKRNLIEAIKIYREVTGVGLKEAKHAVETMAHAQGRY